jgi:hypothetical protein
LDIALKGLFEEFGTVSAKAPTSRATLPFSGSAKQAIWAYLSLWKQFVAASRKSCVAAEIPY